ncbi:hypothetical protein AB0L82_36130 [Nocardia sp. NPDC052001]|uniref:hypothetical protein n=1 Tax=Nocardia sp. NPDC052001 TaxID=3154853 RepID=UPI003438BE92
MSTSISDLDRLVGTWRVSGGADGTTTYAWLDGRAFLSQRVDMNHDGHHVCGLEVIGHERPFGGETSEAVTSRFYSSDGETLDYEYELDGDVLTIWGGRKGSPAYCRTTFSADGNTLSGAWVWPGGGYEATMTRVGQ